MHPRWYVHAHIARRHEENDVAPRLYLGFVGDAFVTLTGSFLFPSFFFFSSSFFIYSAFASTTDRARRFIDWKSKSEFNFGEPRFIFSSIHIP